MDLRTFRRLGGRQEQSVDVRVIAATNANPVEAVRSGKLREDLYYRLNVFAIELPPLRDRREDVPLLIQRFLNEFNVINNKAVKAVDAEAMQILEQYPWPGNIRELRNVIERATILADSDFIGVRHLPPLLVKPLLNLLPAALDPLPCVVHGLQMHTKIFRGGCRRRRGCRLRPT